MSTAVDQLQPRVPARIGQATAVEQSRAIAEVEAAIVVAQRCPRSVPAAIDAMREACKQKALADRAFYRFGRGGQTVTGPSVHLARELARTWGNVQYGISELRRDDEFGQSEMLAFAWDVQTNTRSSSAFIVPHKRDKTGGPIALTDMRDIYENNTNQAARRVREAIFSILPTWFTEEAKDLCAATLSDGGGKPLAQQIADAIAAFGNAGITAGQLETKLGRPSAKWIDQDVATLQVIYRSLMRGEISKDEEFAPERVTVADITGPPKSEAPAAASPPAAAGASPAPKPTAKAAIEALNNLERHLQLGPDADILALYEWILGGPWTASAKQVSDVTKWLNDHVKAPANEGDPEKIRTAIWEQYNRMNPAGGESGG